MDDLKWVSPPASDVSQQATTNAVKYPTTLYPNIEPYQTGMLDVGDGHTLYYEQCGTPAVCRPSFCTGGPAAAVTSGRAGFLIRLPAQHSLRGVCCEKGRV